MRLCELYKSVLDIMEVVVAFCATKIVILLLLLLEIKFCEDMV